MDLRHARTFVSVAELGTVSKAAIQLRIAQPALSRQIVALERELSLKLFDRVGRRLVLTGAGEQLLQDCRAVLSSVSAVSERARLLRRGDTGVLKVAASPQHVENVLSRFLPIYAQRYPNVQVRLFEAVGFENLAMLERGEIHLGQNLRHAVHPDDPRFGVHAFGAVELLAAFDKSLLIGKGDSIEIDRLTPYPLLLLDSGFSIRRTFDAACRLAGLKPDILFESRAPHTLLALAEARQGVAIIPSAMRTEPYRLRVVGVTYRGKPLRESLVMFWDKRRSLPPYATAFCEMLTVYARQALPTTLPFGNGRVREVKVAKYGRHRRRGGGVTRAARVTNRGNPAQ
jgi:LysR family nitrogen assimilation transcriptional regulator